MEINILNESSFLNIGNPFFLKKVPFWNLEGLVGINQWTQDKLMKSNWKDEHYKKGKKCKIIERP